MEVNSYETLIAEVSHTNELLEEQNIKIEEFNSTVSILLCAVLFFKASYIVYCIFSRSYKH